MNFGHPYFAVDLVFCGTTDAVKHQWLRTASQIGQFRSVDGATRIVNNLAVNAVGFGKDGPLGWLQLYGTRDQMKLTVEHLIRELSAHGVSLPTGDVRIGSFGDSEEQSASLIALIVAGTKRGTCSLLWSWHYESAVIPKVGDIEIVLDWYERPVLVLRTINLEIVPFDRITASFAASEGEGDLSLRYWQAEHWRFFTEECRRIGRVADQSMPLVCESFEVLHILAPD